MRRRDFLAATAGGIVTSLYSRSAFGKPEGDRPNILWITCEDISADLGCYGDRYAATPNIDKLASEAVLYTNMYATAPVCSPARSCIITGVHACSLGTQHLRSRIAKPPAIRCFTEYLRDIGYYCSNNSKEDYQFSTPKSAWNESSRKAHWRKRSGEQAFFSVFNLTMTHQSQTRYVGKKLRAVNARLPEALRHDPAEAPLPPYYPDTKLVRENVAAYYTQITLMDRAVGRMLGDLEREGLSENTIVFFFSDHGGGIPRGKRWLHHNGIRVPFMIRCPGKYRHLVPGDPGSRSDRLVSFADLAPAMLSLVGIPVPDYMQGKAFLGGNAAPPRDFVFASRDRVDEVIICSRTVVDGRYQYIRNFMPHRPRMPLSWYSEKTPIRVELRRLHSEGRLKGTATWLLAKTTPAEELYDLSADPHETNNLAGSTEHQGTMKRLRETLYGRMQGIRDTGLLSESEMHGRIRGSPYNGMHDLSAAEYKAILDAARLSGMGARHRTRLIDLLQHADSAVRYWSALGLGVMGAEARPADKALQKALQDSSPSVRVAAAEALCNIGRTGEALRVLVGELQTGSDPVVIEAATALFAVGPKAGPVLEEIRAARKRKLRYGGAAIDHVLGNLQ